MMEEPKENEVEISLFTEEETMVIGCLIKAYEIFRDLPVLIKADRAEFGRAIRQAQQVVMVRPIIRMTGAVDMDDMDEEE